MKLSDLPGGDAARRGPARPRRVPQPRQPRERQDAGRARRSSSSGSARRATKAPGPRRSRCSSTAGRRASTRATWRTTCSSTSSSPTTSSRPSKDHVHIAVTGPGIDGDKTADATKFGPPFYLDNLQDGAYAVKLELLGSGRQAAARPVELDDARHHDRQHRRARSCDAAPTGGDRPIARSTPRSRARSVSCRREWIRSPLLLAATAAIELFAALLFAFAFVRRPAEREYGVAALLCVAARGARAGLARSRRARPTPAAALVGRSRRRGSALLAALPLAVHFALALPRGPAVVAVARAAVRRRLAAPRRARAAPIAGAGRARSARVGARELRRVPPSVGRSAIAARHRHVAVVAAATAVLVLRRRARTSRASARRSRVVVGATVLLATVINDLGVASGALRDRRTWSTPASLAFVVGIATTPSARYAVVTRGARAAHARAAHADARAAAVVRGASRRAGGAGQEGAARGGRRARRGHRARGPKPARHHRQRRAPACASRPSRARTTRRCSPSSTRRRAA